MAARSDRVKTRLEVDGEEAYVRKMKKAEDALDTFAGGGGAISKKLRGISAEAAVAVSGFFAIQSAAGAVTGVVRGMADAAEAAARGFHELGMRGGDVSAVATAYERIGDQALLSRLREVSGVLVRNQELMARSTQAIRTGIVDREEFTRWIEVTTRAAQDMGRPVEESIRAVTTALSGGGMESLAQLGVNVLEIRRQVQLAGDTMETTTGRAMAMRLAMSQLAEDLGTVDNSAGNLNDAWTQISTTWENWVDEVARAFSENRQLVDLFVELRQALEESLPPGEEMAETLSHLFVDGLSAARDLTGALLATAEALSTVGSAALRVTDAVPWLVSPSFTLADQLGEGADTGVARLDSLSEAISRMRGELEETDPALQRLRASTGRMAQGEALELGSTLDDIREPLQAAYEAVRDVAGEIINLRSPTHSLVAELNALGEANRALADSSRQSADDIRDEAAALAELARAAAEGPDWVAAQAAQTSQGNFQGHGRPQQRPSRGGQRQPGLDRMAALRAEADYQREVVEASIANAEKLNELQTENLELRQAELEAVVSLHEKERERIEQQRELSREVAEAEFEEAQRRAELLEHIKDLEEEMAAARRARIDSILDDIQTYGQAITVVGGAVADAFGQMAASQEEGSKAAERYKKIQGGVMAAMSFVQAAIEVAAAIQSFAKQDYGGGVLHVASAAAYTTAGVMALTQLGGSAQQGSATATGTFVPERKEKESSSSEGGGTQLIFYDWNRSSARLGKEVIRANRALERSGVDMPMIGGGYYG